ncbi:hypothetical protein [Burkholderia vietnamiensis]|uniref:hypothetical protein n=1 Tax=Burkholderia vietnamiensis TaxID=60552 RepID=UPI00264F6722|nr:hypothetical protein [Burkholderia vietnamiensis]MDN8035777.1 hypothetical protein [Burkholderia vietnamiensis]
MDGRHGDELTPTKRDHIISEHLRKNGIFDIEEAPDDILEEAMEIADKALGKGKDN